ncbi:MAG: PorV/PorQ family protein [Elusimicrobiota bacterium]
MKRLLLIIILLTASSLEAADNKLAEGAASYLEMGVDCRAAAMGNAFVAAVDNASAICWNPAVLSGIGRHSATMMTSVSSRERKHNFVGCVLPVDDKTGWLPKEKGLGIGWVNYGIGDIQGSDTYGNPTEKFSDSENALYFAFGQQIAEKYSAGIAFKYLVQSLTAAAGARGIGFDAAFFYDTGNKLLFGLNIQNIFGSLKWKIDDPVLQSEYEYSEQVLVNIKAGSAYRLMDKKLLLAFDVDKTVTQKIRAHFGGEYEIAEDFRIRTGYDASRISFGFGWDREVLDSKFLFFNYALLYEKYGFDTVHRISIDIFSGRKKKKKEKGEGISDPVKKLLMEEREKNMRIPGRTY